METMMWTHRKASGRLDYFDAVVLIPRPPLEHGATYDVRITSSAQKHAWSFTLEPDAR